MSNIQHIVIEVTRDPGRHIVTEHWQYNEDGTPSHWAHRIDPTTWLDDLRRGMWDALIGRQGRYLSASDGC
jgi:hypothetical protein